MFDLEKLYKRYLIFKIKKIFPLFLVFFVAVIIAYIYSIKFLFPISENKKEVISKEIISKEVVPKKVLVEKKIVQKIHNKKEPAKAEIQKHYKFFTLSVREKNRASIERVQKRYLKFGLECKIEEQNNYLNLVCGETNSYKESEKIKNLLKKHRIKYYLVTKKEVPMVEGEQTPKKKKIEQQEKIKQEEKEVKVEQKPKKELFINMTHSDVDMKLLQEKFARHGSYEIAIRIAKEYYTKKKYEQSLIWSKRANSLNRKKTDSWILYARSLYALGRKEKAVKVLMLYKRFASSTEVNRILQGWQNDK